MAVKIRLGRFASMANFKKGAALDKAVGTEDYFPTQGSVKSNVVSMTEADRRFGAPCGPVPASFRRLPVRLEICASPASVQELQTATTLREPFLIKNYPAPYVHDIVRAFRQLSGLKSYLEVGTFDRGNLRYVSSLLADDALLIGVDTQDEPNRDAQLRSLLKPGQRYVSIVGDSRESSVVQKVAQALNGAPLQATFIDGCHTAHAVLCDYANYGDMVASGGVVMFHDSVWEGDDTYKGSADALAEIDKLDPIYLVPGQGHPYRFMRTMWRDAVWGVVAVHLKDAPGVS